MHALVRLLGKKPTPRKLAIKKIVRLWNGGERTNAAALMRAKEINPEELPGCPGIDKIK